MSEQRSELAQTTLSVIFIGGLLIGSVWILRPFVGAFIWATMIVVATWPLMRRVERILGGSRKLAVAVMCVALLAILIVPLAIAVNAILLNAPDVPALAARLADAHLPAAPAWLARLPIIGGRAAAAWNTVAGTDPAVLAERVLPYVRGTLTWLLRGAGSFAFLLVQFLVVVVLSAVLFAAGESWAAWVRRFGRRLADEQGERMVVLAGQAIRGVALGVIVTALVQTALGSIGLLLADVPFAAILTAIMFMLCIAQVGPLLVLLPATAWVYLSVGPGWGTAVLVWSLGVGLLDNFLRPILIRQGADLPLLLIIGGVLGGLVTFGVIEIFVGPVVLAVAYTLLDDWVDRRHESEPPL